MMRLAVAILIATLLPTSEIVMAQSPDTTVPLADKSPPAKKSQQASKGNKGAENQKSPTVPPPPVINLSVSGDLDLSTQPAQAAEQRQQKDWWESFWFEIRITDVLLVVFTGLLAWFTGGLRSSTEKLWAVAKGQAADTTASLAIAKESADAAKAAADAAVNASRPVLLPRVVYAIELALPDARARGPVIDFQPEILFVFENFGKGVATITKVTSELLVFGDIPEERTFEKPRIASARVVVPGEYKVAPGSSHTGMNTFRARLAKPITAMTEIEPFRKSKMPFKRFFLVGVVEYEDLFGFSYEGGFSLKVFPDLVQGIRGGAAFNYYKYKKKN